MNCRRRRRITSCFWEGCPLPPGRPLIGGICELPDDERDDERVINGLVELAAQYVIEPDLETVLAAESDADAEAAELPAGGEPRVQAFVDRERAEAKEKRKRKKEKPLVPPPPEGLNSWCELHSDEPADRPAEGLPPWTSDDLDQELLHSLGIDSLSAPNARPQWKQLIDDGADE